MPEREGARPALGYLDKGKSAARVARDMGRPDVNLISVRDLAVAKVRQKHPALIVDPAVKDTRRRIA